MNIVYVEYDLAGPNRMPWSAAPDKDGIVWMPFYGKQNKIGRLDPVTGETKEFTVPNTDTALVHSHFPLQMAACGVPSLVPTSSRV